MIDPITLVPPELREYVIGVDIAYQPMETDVNEEMAWVKFPRYSCLIDDDQGNQGQGSASVNENRAPEEAHALSIERATESLLAWRSYGSTHDHKHD